MTIASEVPVDGREGLVLFFIVGGHTLATRLTNVARIDEVDTSETELTHAVDDMTEGIDLRRFFDVREGERGNKRVTIVFEGERGRFLVVADGVDGVVPAGEAPEVGWPPQMGGEAARIFSGFFRRGDKLVPAINVSRLRELAKHASR